MVVRLLEHCYCTQANWIAIDAWPSIFGSVVMWRQRLLRFASFFQTTPEGIEGHTNPPILLRTSAVNVFLTKH